jgi:predicted permease
MIIETLSHDLHSAWRSLRRAPVVTALSIATIGFAAGLVTTASSVFSGLTLYAPPYANAQRLLALSAATADRNTAWSSVPAPAVSVVYQQLKSFERICEYNVRAVAVARAGGVSQLLGTEIDTGFFALFGVRAARGRLPSRREILAREPVVAISDSLSRALFAGPTDAIGATVIVDGMPRVVVGVLPAQFRFDRRSSIWMPEGTASSDSGRPSPDRWVSVVGLLRVGVERKAAVTEAAVLNRLLALDRRGLTYPIQIVIRDRLEEQQPGALTVLSSMILILAVGVLLIASVNVGNVQAVRAVSRQGEIAVRAALGASRRHLLAQGAAEYSILAVLAAGVGAGVTVWLEAGVRHFVGALDTELSTRIVLNGYALAVAVLTSIAVVAAIGLLPMRTEAWGDPAGGLRSNASSSTSSRQAIRTMRRSVGIQAALSTMLAIASGLFLRSYQAVIALDRGYAGNDVVRIHVALLEPAYKDGAARTQFMRALRQRLAGDSRIQGMALAGYAQDVVGTSPPERHAGVRLPSVPDTIYSPGAQGVPLTRLQPPVRRLSVSDGYFALTGIRIVRGRAFDARDVPGAPLSAIVSERMAYELWGTEPAVGKTFRLGAAGPSYIVVGVAGDTRDPTTSRRRGPSTAAWPTIYTSEQQVTTDPDLLLRAHLPLGVSRMIVEQAAHQIDPLVPVWPARTLFDDAGDAIEALEIIGGIAVGLAVCGGVLTVLGVYGVIAFSVAVRTREVALRIALGASQADVIGLVVKEGVTLSLFGVAVGAAVAAILTPQVSFILWNTSPWDLGTYAVSASVVLVAGAIASWVPSRGVARIAPAAVLAGRTT